MTTKELEVYGGEIVRKCTLEHFQKPQWLHGSPYFYLVQYNRHSKTDDIIYALWRFNTESLKYELYQTADKKSSNILDDIADKWEEELWAEKFKQRNGGYEEK
jgi:hypothetical protein